MPSIDLKTARIDRVKRTLKRRRRHLRRRIEYSQEELSYDKAECQALNYAIALVVAVEHHPELLDVIEKARDYDDEASDL